MSATFEDVTSILDENKGNKVVPYVCFNPTKKELKKTSFEIKLEQSPAEINIESVFDYLSDFTVAIGINESDALYESSRTLPIRLTSAWGNKMPNFTNYAESNFVDNYELLEKTSKKATKKFGW